MNILSYILAPLLLVSSALAHDPPSEVKRQAAIVACELFIFENGGPAPASAGQKCEGCISIGTVTITMANGDTSTDVFTASASPQSSYAVENTDGDFVAVLRPLGYNSNGECKENTYEPPLCVEVDGCTSTLALEVAFVFEGVNILNTREVLNGTITDPLNLHPPIVPLPPSAPPQTQSIILGTTPGPSGNGCSVVTYQTWVVYEQVTFTPLAVILMSVVCTKCAFE